MNESTAMERAAEVVNRLQPFPTAEQTIAQLRTAQLQEVPAMTHEELQSRTAQRLEASVAGLRITEVPQEPARQYIDCTPESLKTLEGRERVGLTLKAWEETHAEVANLATQFIALYGDEIRRGLAGELDGATDDFDELQDAIDNRQLKQDAFVRAMANCPPAANAYLATDEEIAESAATMTQEERQHVASFPRID